MDVSKTGRRWAPPRSWLAGLLFLQAGAPLAAQVVNFTNYTAVDGVPQSQVFAVLQDHRSFIWFGTYGGLTRFDGAEFRTWGKESGLPSSAVSALATDAQGRLLVGTFGGGVCRFDGARFRCVGPAEGLPDQDVVDVLPEPGGRFWVATEAGLALVDDEFRVERFTEAQGLPSRNVHRLARDAAGTLWVGTERGLARLWGGRFEAHPAAEARAAIRFLAPHHGGLVVGTAASVFVVGQRVGALPGLGAHPGLEYVAAASDTSGVLWIATRSGVLRHDGRTAQLLSEANGLGNHDVNAVALDREGNIWLGTEGGLSKLTPGPFSQYTTGEGVPNPFVRAFAEDRQGRLWIGTRDGIARFDGRRFVTVPLPGAPDRRVYSLLALGDTLLIATRQGIVVHRGTVRRVLGPADGLPSPFVTSLVRDSSGRVWIGTAQGVARWEPGRGRIEPVRDSLLQSVFATTLALGPKGELWVGRRAGGVVVYDGTRSRPLGPGQGLGGQAVWSLAMDSSRTMWVGTNGDGVFIVRPDGRINRLTTSSGLINDFVWQTLPDRAGYVWLFTSQGLDRYSPQGGLVHYGKGDGLREVEGSATAALQDRGGDIWFGTGAGAIRYVAARDLPSAVPPPIEIEALTSRHGALGADGRVPARPGVIRARYTAASFRDPTRVRFRYRMFGIDDQWSDLTPERSVSFAGLAPGRYRFEVEAYNDDGLVSPAPAALAFAVLPAFWQTWWFRALALAVLAATAALVPFVRGRRLARDHQRLERLVAQHTETLAAQNAKLEREVSERVAAEEEVRRQEQRVREVVEHSTNLFYSYTPDHRITYLSPQARQFIGTEPDQAPRRWTELLTDHPDNAEGIEHSRRALATGRKQPPYDLELQAGPGRRLWVQVNEAPVVRDGEVVAIVGSLTNISDAKLAREKQHRLEVQLQQAQKMEAVGRLAGGIAHDFNNLLTAVVGHTDFAVESLPPESPAQADLAVIRRAADRASSLVAQLLAFSRQQMVKRRAIDLNVVTAEAVRMLHRVLGSDIEIVVELAPEATWVMADHGQLDQILLNLAVNARDAMPSGGRLVIGTEEVDLREALADDVPEGPYVVLRVSDTGTGMDSATRSRVFEPFFTTKGVGKGTGLGLAMVYGIVKQNGGHIVVDTTVGQGTTFRLYFPRTQRPRAFEAVLPPARPAAPAPEANGRKVVLVVEDEDGVRKLACRTLTMHGYQVLEAPDGQTAVELAERYADPIDLLVSDMIMPGMNGRQVAQAITERRRDTKVLFMSGHADGVLGRNNLIDQEGTHLLRKPFTPAELAKNVRELLSV